MTHHPRVQAVIDRHTESLQKQVDELLSQNKKLQTTIFYLSGKLHGHPSRFGVSKIFEFMGLDLTIVGISEREFLSEYWDSVISDLLQTQDTKDNLPIPNLVMTSAPASGNGGHLFGFLEDGKPVPNDAFNSSKAHPSHIDELSLIDTTIHHEKKLINYEFTDEQNAELSKSVVDFFKMMMEEPNPAPNDERSVATDLPSALTTPTPQSLDDNSDKQGEPKDMASTKPKKTKPQEKKK